MKILGINYNNRVNHTTSKKSPSFKGYHENYIKTYDKYVFQKLGEGYSSTHNKEVILGGYKSLIKALKEFPAKYRTQLFDEIFNDPKYLESPYTLLEDLHNGEGSMACKALSVEANKHHNSSAEKFYHSYPLVINEKNKACLVLARITDNPLVSGLRRLIYNYDKKNGDYQLIFLKDYHHTINHAIGFRKHFYYCNNSEDTSHAGHSYYKAHEFHRDFEHYRSYDQ